MGALFSGLWSYFIPTRPYKLLILGLSNAGKTSILYHLQLGHCIATQPTLGSNTEHLSVRNARNSHTIELICWDLGGQSQLRESWRVYFDRTDALIFVVDAADPERLPAARRVLHALLRDEPLLRHAVLLVLANKQDLAGAAGLAELVEALDLGAVRERTWTLMGCSAVSGESLREAMAWVAQKVADAAEGSA